MPFNVPGLALARKYLDGIKDLKDIKPLLSNEPEKHVYQMFGIRVEKRDDLMIYLKSKGIATNSHYTPLGIQPLFKPYGYDCDFIEKEHYKKVCLNCLKNPKV